MVLTHWAATACAVKSSMVMASFAWLQDAATAPSTVSHGNSVLLEVFVGMAAVAMFVVAMVVAVVAVGAYRMQKDLMAHVEEIKGKLLPLIASSQGLVTDLTPQIKEITGKVNEISGRVNEIVVVVKEKVDEFSPTVSQANVTFKEILDKTKVTVEEANQTVKGVNERARGQIDRVNGMVTGALDATTKLGKAIEYGISVPGRELSGFITSAKKTVDGLMEKSGTGLNGLVGRVAMMFGGAKTSERSAGGYRPTSGSARYASAPPARRATVVPVEGSYAPPVATSRGPGVPSGSGNGDPIL